MKSFREAHWLRQHTRSGLHFVNGIIHAAGREQISQAEYDQLRAEVRANRNLAEQYERHIPRLRQISPHKQIADWQERCARAEPQIDIFYVLFRLLRPAVVVETGVATGSMTSFILAALHKNQHGTLNSFDIPPIAGERTMDWTATGKEEIGFLIPETYKDRWNLTFGDATYELPQRFQKPEIDCFFHDSDHTFQHMTFEYAFAEKHLAPGGWVISDDISWNDAFRNYFDGRWHQFIRRGMPNIGVAVPR